MASSYFNVGLRKIIVVFLLVFVHKVVHAQNFDQSLLDFNGFGNASGGVTSLMYGPDGRLYVAEYPGLIKILTIARNSSTDYEVTTLETLSQVKDIPNHDDDGSNCSGISAVCNSRETTGLTVGGTPSNPVFYVASSDFRIGAGSGGGNGDVNLDTNSGIITRFTWTGTSWDVVDIVRGLPRSEENHATNGLELATINGTDYLIVASGGNTNAGAPSTNFVHLTEYALSAAVLAIDLDMLEGMDTLMDNGRKYIYDIPTMDDPTRANANGITDPDNPGYTGVDVNDPWGGNDGLNQAMIVPNGPVQILSPGYRNAYDLVVTQNGALYVTDNGANGGWGGFPVNEGGGSVTNDYDSSEPGSQSPSGNEQIDNRDHLQLVTTDLQNYTFGSTYGGHPAPIRANPGGAGLYTAPGVGTAGAVFRTQKYDPNGSTPGSSTNQNMALPANWPPVPLGMANAVEGDWRGPTVNNPDGPEDDPVVVWGTNTNGIDEYTASNFGGAMQGNLLAGDNNGILRRVELNASGGSSNFTANFLSGIGGNPLGVTCNSDQEIFPGSIWVGTLNGRIVVFEPGDFVDCINPGEQGYDANADYDNDGYANIDELDNGNDHCNGGSQPADFDKAAGGTLISDINDLDDDADGISDATDPFQLGDPTTGGSDTFSLPINNDLFNDQQGLGGIFGLGMTGLMNNGDANNNWLDWIDRRDDPNDPNPNDVLGGAPGLMTSHMTDGTAMGNSNNQDKGYQYGVQVDNSTGPFVVTGGMNGFTGPLRLYGNTAAVGGELGFFIGDGTQSNYIKFVVTTDGFTALQEINDVPQTPIQMILATGDRPTSGIRFYFNVFPQTGQVGLEYEIDGGQRILLGSITAQGSILNAIQNSADDLAVGFIGTSNTPGVELEGTWDFLNVEENGSTNNLLSWTDKDENEDYTARHENSFVQAGDKFYLMGGRESSRTVDIYDYTSDSWTSLVDSAPFEFNHFQAIEYQGLIWVIGAFSTNAFPNEVPANNIWMFNPATQEWIQGPQIPTNRRRGSAGLVVYNDKFYVIGGNTDGHDGGFVAQFDEFDPTTGIWTPLTDAPRARDHFAAAVIGDKLYAAGGRLSGGNQGVWKPVIAEVDVYDFTSNTWSTLPIGQNLPTPRGGASTVNFNNKLIVLGGEVRDELVYGVNTDDALNISEEYDPVTQSWTRLTDMNFERHGTQAIVSGPGVHILGGSPNRGGGNQKNLEFLGQDSPVGNSSVASTLQVPGTAAISSAGSAIPLDISGGNIGIFINSIEIIGADTADFDFVSGQLSNAVLAPNSSHDVTLSFLGAGSNQSVSLLITYNGSETSEVALTGSTSNVVWLEDFEDLSDGTVTDNDSTAWTSFRNGGSFDVQNNAFEVRGGSSAPGVWTSEVISIGGTVTISLDIDDINANKEASDFIRAYYVLDGGAQVLFGEVKNDLDTPVTLTSLQLVGSTVQIVIEGKVSANNEIYRIDNVTVFGSTGGGPDFALTVDNGSGDGNYLEGTQVVVTADTAPSGQEFDSWTGDITNLSDPNSASTTLTMPAANVTITASYRDLPTGGGGIVWLEDFEDLSNGTVVDNGTTAWSAVRNGGVFEVENGAFRVNGGSSSPGVWTSEVIPMGGGTVTISLDVDDINTNKEAADFVRAYYVLDGGAQVQFGEVKDDLSVPVTLTSMELTGNTVQIIIEGQVSAGNENYFIDNVMVSGNGGNDPEFILIVENGSGDGSYLEGTQVMVTADVAPSGQQFDNWTGDITNLANPNSASTTLTMPAANITITASYSDLPTGGGGVVWLEDFEDLSDGTVVDNGATAWSADRNGGFFDVQDNAFEVRGGSADPGVWTSEVIVIGGGTATISLDIDDINTNKEASDFVRVYYVLDGGAQVLFGEVKNDLDVPVTLTSPELVGSTVQIVIEGKVSANNEIYRIDNVTVTTSGPVANQPPVAVAMASIQSGTAPLLIDFTGSNSTDDTGIVAYAWDFKDGNTSTLTDPTNTFMVAGTYDVELTVTDGENETDTTTITITVDEPGVNLPPVAVAMASVQSGTAPFLVDFTGSNSTDDMGVVTYAWDFKDGNTSTLADPTNTFMVAGTYDVELTVTDGENEMDTTTITIIVNEPSTDGVISLTLIDAVTDTDLFDLSQGQQIDFGSSGGMGLNFRANTNPSLVGSVAFVLTGPVANTRTESSAPYALFGDASGDYSENDLPLGNYTLTATAFNGSGQSGGVLGQPLVINFSIVDNNGGGNQAPVAIAIASEESGTVPLTVDFTGSNSTDDSGIVSYAWDFKDGNTSTIADPSNTFTIAGTYEVALTVTDAENETDSTTINILVTEPGSNQPPAVINPGTQNNNENDVISLQIVATDESMNLTYQATGLPPTLAVNPNSGLISGTITGGSSSGSFLENSGLVIIEAESGDTTGWNITNLDGETGIIANTNSFNNQNGSTIPYEITVNTPGVYRFNWNSFYSGPSPTEENDNWVRFPNNNDVWFFGVDNPSQSPGSEANIIANLQGSQTNIVFPKGSSRITSATTPNGNGSNGYFKVFRSGGNAEDYKWQARTSDNDPHNIYVWFVNPGTYTMEISERSNGHAIDRVALYKVDGPDYSDSQLSGFSESATSGGNQGAAVNSPYSVEVTVLDNGVPQESATIAFDWIVGTDSGGGGNPGTTAIDNFTLINADTNSDLFVISDGMQIQESTIQGMELNIRANTSPSIVGSVALSLAGPVSNNRTENGAPYTLFGDNGSTNSGEVFPPGNYTLSAIPYSGSSLSGTAGQTLTVQFTVVSLSNSVQNASRQADDLDENSIEVSLMPNPTASFVEVVIDSPESSKAAMGYLFDMSGRLLKKMAIGPQFQNKSQFEIDMSGMETGIYILQIWSDSKVIMSQKKVVVKK